MKKLGPIEAGYARYRAGEMTNDEALHWFQRLADTGWGWRYPPDIGRTLAGLIVAGLVQYPESQPIPPRALGG